MTATPLRSPPTPAPELPPNAGDTDSAAGTLAVANAALRGGFVLLPRTLLHAPGLSRDAKLLYAVLLSYAWQRGSCFPGYERLQQDLGCGVNQVTRYLRELEAAGLVTRRKRGQGKTTLYTLRDPLAPPPGSPPPGDASASAPQTHQIGESGVTDLVTPDPPIRRHKEDSAGREADEHQPPVVQATAPSRPRPPLAPTDLPPQKPAGAGDDDDDDVLELLISRGVTRRIARDLTMAHPAAAIRQQVAWQAYRPAATSPAGALVRAIRDAWPPPPAWREAQAHAVAIARQAEEEARRREEEAARRRAWAAKPPEERIAGRLQFWLLQQRAKRREPSEAERAAKRAELLAEAAAQRPGGPSGGAAG